MYSGDDSRSSIPSTLVPQSLVSETSWLSPPEECYRKAVEHGDMDAHVNLAKCLMTGDGVAADQAEAQRHLIAAGLALVAFFC